MVTAEVEEVQAVTEGEKNLENRRGLADKRNMEILATALQGLDRAQSQFDQAAAKISQAGISDTGSSGDTVDLAQEIVNLAVAKDEYMANLKALQAGNDLTKHTIDILA